MAEIDPIEGADPTPADLGDASYGRRLSDKVLAAFNHAYAQGRAEVADLLLQSLNQCRQIEGEARTGAALEKARLWMLFVQARDRYAELRKKGGAGAAEAARLMTEAYRRWADG